MIKVRKNNEWVEADTEYAIQVILTRFLGEHILNVLKKDTI